MWIYVFASVWGWRECQSAVECVEAVKAVGISHKESDQDAV